MTIKDLNVTKIASATIAQYKQMKQTDTPLPEALLLAAAAVKEVRVVPAFAFGINADTPAWV